ncbi:tetratricopeptide repeat protein [Thermomonas sp. S9]|uniref:tetratricopeptide repeat protein n=1 Tax=Thermomonas sp. S9 TaxID=2885203 RepID=UPI00216AC4F4|nr:tetratricopeptide repeat protein [Thermomonas sp. S9]MCR6496032.1 tetratricopeptide repeat protein [Thermomonas sp. S9]
MRLVLVVLALWAGWRIYGQLRAEQAVADDAPALALQWRPEFSAALLAQAERQLAAGDLQAAQDSARRVLANSPLRGQAFRILAQVAERRGDAAQALRLYQIASRRAPRDLPSRAWLAQHYLQQGQYPAALAQIDSLLRMSPTRAAAINPVLVQMAQEPAFADALAHMLAGNPPWRDGTLAALRHPKIGNPEAAGRIMQALQAQGGLSQDEYDRWLDSLMAQGRWGEAYARWASGVPKPDGRLPLLYNGDFRQPPSNAGFDWRVKRVPGVLLDFVPDAGIRGQAAYLNFLDRRVPEGGLSQPLLLGPGHYRLGFRARATALRSEMGLQWQVVCAGSGTVLARSDPLQGNMGWTGFQMEFSVPPTGCPGQWLRLVNPVPAGAAQRISGELWLTGFTLLPQT